jgi:hypothetical protein
MTVSVEWEIKATEFANCKLLLRVSVPVQRPSDARRLPLRGRIPI